MWAKQKKKFYAMHSPRILWHLQRFWSRSRMLHMDTGWTSLETTYWLFALNYIYFIYDNVYHNWTKNIIMRIDSPPLLFRPSFCQRPSFLLKSCNSYILFIYFILFLKWPDGFLLRWSASRSLGATLMECHCHFTLAIHSLNLETVVRYAIDAKQKKYCWKPTDQ